MDIKINGMDIESIFDKIDIEFPSTARLEEERQSKLDEMLSREEQEDLLRQLEESRKTQ